MFLKYFFLYCNTICSALIAGLKRCKLNRSLTSCSSLKYCSPFPCVYRSSRELWTILLGRSALREPVSPCLAEQVCPSLSGLHGQIHRLYMSLNISESVFCCFSLGAIFVPLSPLLVHSSTPYL